MTLYHFTCKNYVQSILKEGLTKGVMCIGQDGDKFYFIQDIQWLTDLKSIQSTTLEKSYRQERLIVDIPEDDKKLLSPGAWKKKFLGVVFKGFKGAYTTPDNNHYWIYHGQIPPEWIREG